ncbi:MAG TPA: hypothetical protein VF815_45120 [Myxococcaceae bacterium]|jgi:hypothetical protein
MGLTNVIFEGRTIENERLEFRDRNALYYLGPNLLLRSCTLVLKVPTSRLLLPGAKFIDCSLEVKRDLKNLSWYKAHFKGCRFTGRLISCDFGYDPYPVLPREEVGGIEDCDFSAAHIHACRFMGCDSSTLRFPRWPYFTILDPVRRMRELASAWPRELWPWRTTIAGSPETTAAITFSAPELAKEANVSEEQLWTLLEGHSDVLY